MEMDNNNPFKAPEARVADITADMGEFLPEGRQVPAGNGAAWLGGGWRLFKSAPGTWMGLMVIYFLMMLAMAIIPFVGGVGFNLLMPVFMGGIMMGCKAIEDGEGLRVGHLFAAFSGHAGNLVLVGLLYIVGIFAIVIIAMLIGGVGMGIGGLMSGNLGMAAIVSVILLVLLALALMIPLAMAIWFAPPLIVFHEVPPFDAMKTSFVVCLKNFAPFLVYGLALFVVGLLICAPLFLGLFALSPMMMAGSRELGGYFIFGALICIWLLISWLVLAPVMMASIYTSYRDMFIHD